MRKILYNIDAVMLTQSGVEIKSNDDDPHGWKCFHRRLG